jgi:putative membrane protein
MSSPDRSPRTDKTTLVLRLIMLAYVAARVLEVAPNSIPRTAIVALDVLSALAFALVHGTRHYGLRGILAFAAICTIIGNTTENLSIDTGFPFGHYYFAELMGPKLFQVPILLGLAYIGMAYVSWIVACLIRGSFSVSGARILAIPITASFIMVAWDLAQDPVWATVLHGWIWRDGGAWFGVPVSNYIGWYFNVFLIYLCFAFYLRRQPAPPTVKARNAWWPAILFYALCAACNVLQTIPNPVPAIVHDPTGTPWRVADITRASALVSIFVMGTFAALACARLIRQQNHATG